MCVFKVILCLLIPSWSLLVTAEINPISHPNVAVEGGSVTLTTKDTTHMGREHMLKVNVTIPQHMIKVNHTHIEKTTTEVPAFEVGQKNDNTISVPRKEATLDVNTNVGLVNSSAKNVSNSFNASISTSTTAATTTKSNSFNASTSTNTTAATTTKNVIITTPKPHKPTLTIGEDEESANPLKTETNDTPNHGLSIESVVHKTKKTDYVVPIVAIILSVPIVAIVFSVLYKRGSDWWQHRHYRRMDFLIEGMYNN